MEPCLGYYNEQFEIAPEELDGIKFAEGFSRISDLEVGPDGYLFVLAFGKGTIYRIVAI